MVEGEFFRTGLRKEGVGSALPGLDTSQMTLWLIPSGWRSRSLNGCSAVLYEELVELGIHARNAVQMQRPGGVSEVGTRLPKLEMFLMMSSGMNRARGEE